MLLGFVNNEIDCHTHAALYGRQIANKYLIISDAFVITGVFLIFTHYNLFCHVAGLFFQWIMCSAIWLVGVCVQAIRDFPTFYPLAMLGGMLWATGQYYSLLCFTDYLLCTHVNDVSFHLCRTKISDIFLY